MVHRSLSEEMMHQAMTKPILPHRGAGLRLRNARGPPWLYLAAMLLAYAVLTQLVKTWFIRRFGE